MMQVETNISHFYQDLKIMNQLKKLDCCSGHKQLSTEPLRYAMCSLQGSYKLKMKLVSVLQCHIKIF